MNNSPSVVFLDLASLDKDDLDINALREHAADFKAYPSTSPEQVQERIAGRSVVITNKVVIDEAAMQSNPELRLILVAATGMNNIDLQAAERLGIQVRNCQAYGTPAVDAGADYALRILSPGSKRR